MSKIVEKPVESFRQELICSKNNCDGIMEWTGRQLTMSPPIYPHFCPKCKNETWENDIFPKIVNK